MFGSNSSQQVDANTYQDTLNWSSINSHNNVQQNEWVNQYSTEPLQSNYNLNNYAATNFNYDNYLQYQASYLDQQTQYQQGYYNSANVPSFQNVNVRPNESDKVNISANLHLNDVNDISKSDSSEAIEANEKSINHSGNSEKENFDESVSNKSPSLATSIPAYFTTQKIVNNTSKLSYTVYQLELLNAIYIDMKYPNSVQKTLIAKLIGITRDQVKIWFQNRRRKDTLVSQGKIPNVASKSQTSKRRRSSDESENNEDELLNSQDLIEQNGDKKQVVENKVIEGVLYQLKIHQNAPSRLSSKRTKLNPENLERPSKEVIAQKNRIISTSTSTKPQESALPVTVPNYHQNDFNLYSKPSSYTANQIDFNYGNNKIHSMATSTTLTPTSSVSSSCSSSSSGSSSSEEEVYGKHLKQPSSFLKLPVAFSIQNYVESRFLPKQSNSARVYNNNYQASGSYEQFLPTVANRSNAWTVGATTPTVINSSYVPIQPTNQIAIVHDSGYFKENSNGYNYYSQNLPTGYETAGYFSNKYDQIVNSELSAVSNPHNYQQQMPLNLTTNSYNYCA